MFISDSIIKTISNTTIPENVDIEIDGEGRFLIPGLFDSHIHLFQSGGLYTRPDIVDLRHIRDYETEREWLRANAGNILQHYLRCGITSVIDVGGPLYNFQIRDKIEYSRIHPNLFLTGPLISTYQPEEFPKDDPPIIKVSTSDEARSLVRRQLDYNPDFIKIWYITLPSQSAESMYDIVKATIEESHLHKLPVVVHATELNTAKLALHAGADLLAHSVDDAVDEDFIELLKQNEASYIPTMIVHRNYVETLTQNNSIGDEDLQYAPPVPVGTMFDFNHLLDSEELAYFKDNEQVLNSGLKEQESMRQKNLVELVRSGINVATGTDAGNIGTHHASSYYDELRAMTEAGLTNADVLRASTINAASSIGKQNELGSIEEGKQADLILLGANPLESIDALKQIEFVVKSGHTIKIDTLIKETPESIVQKQLNAYNARNADAFLECFSDSVRIYNFPNELRSSGIKEMGSLYQGFFEENLNLYCRILNRTTLGNTVIDREYITGLDHAGPLNIIAIYKVNGSKIEEVYFIRE